MVIEVLSVRVEGDNTYFLVHGFLAEDVWPRADGNGNVFPLRADRSSADADRMTVVSLQEKEFITMRKRLLLWVAAVGVLLPAIVAAADINGKWKAEFTTPDGQQRVNTFSFKVEGGKLTGMVKGSQDETPIQSGKVDGDEISFSAERPFGAFSYKGKVGGDQIKFKVEFNGQKFEITAKRVSN